MSTEVRLAWLYDGKTVRSPSEFVERSERIVSRFPFDPHLRMTLIEIRKIVHKEQGQ